MKRTFLVGIATALIGGLGLWIGGMLGMSFQNTIMGVGGGLIAGSVLIGSPLGRLAGLVIGFLLGVFFDAMRLGLLPGGVSVLGVAVALMVMLLVATLVSGLSVGRISMWSMLLGALTFVAGFNSVLVTTPWSATQQLPSQFFSLLAMAAIGFLTVVPAELLPEKKFQKGQPAGPKGSAPTNSDDSAQSLTPINEIIGGAK